MCEKDILLKFFYGADASDLRFQAQYLSAIYHDQWPVDT